MSEHKANQFNRVARHNTAQLLLTQCMGRSLSFVSDLLQGRPTSCSGASSLAETSIIEKGLLTTEQASQLSSRCMDCRRALNGAAEAWKKRDRAALTEQLNLFRDAQGRVRGAIVAVAG